MKRRIFLIAASLVMSVICFSSYATERIFSRFSDMDGVSSVYIGETILKLAGNSLETIPTPGNLKTSKLVSKLNGIEIVSCEKQKQAKKISKAIDEVIGSIKGLELEMEVSEDSDKPKRIAIYTQEDYNTGNITTLIVFVKSETEPAVVVLHGDFTAEDLADVLSGAKSIAKEKSED